ncbi:MAG: ATP-dependent DNA helicase RecG [Candidatus Omnitrophota bacterium]
MNFSIRYIKAVGPRREQVFYKMGIATAEDILYYFPRKYEDRCYVTPIAKVAPGNVYTVRAKVLAGGERASWRRRRFKLLHLVVEDDSGRLAVVWFNQPYLKKYLSPGTQVVLHGRVEAYQGRLQMSSPEFEVLAEDGEACLSCGRIVPIYSLPSGMTQRYFRHLVHSLLKELVPEVCDILPYAIRSKYGLLNLARSLVSIHFPESGELHKQAYRRLAFEEFFLHQLLVLMRKRQRARKQGIAHCLKGDVFSALLKSLPFSLTAAQRRVLSEIERDMASRAPMQRLLHGEVGSGKTIVALLAAAIAADSGYQVAFMVPTEILARQHFANIRGRMAGAQKDINVGLLVGSSNKKQQDKTREDIASGAIDAVIGTHSLLQEEVRFKNLGLVIIDEQHKFGVGQRALLPQKGDNPDCLIMTATPIPRTLSLTIYGDLDISVLDEIPSGRPPIETRAYTSKDSDKAYAFMAEQVNRGRQAYIICPRIEDEEAPGASAVEVYARARKRFKGFKVGLVHSQVRQQEQVEVMRGFAAGDIDILVATTVLEVGVDVANASLMIIEYAEHFGLSQLHQLRGRIGRGSHRSYCLLIVRSEGQEGRERVKAVVRSRDGFRISEEDLKIRGPGEFFGLRQHGLSELKIANPLTQMQLLKQAREEAVKLLSGDHNLTQRQDVIIGRELKKRFSEFFRTGPR